jgi:flagellar hook-associated protein 1 FlgK
MYISSYLTLNTALSGVEAAQEELDTTGENISNENTIDYEEQSVNLVESNPLSIAGSGADGAMQLGTGVQATGISNAGDPYLDAAWRAQNASTTAATTTQGFLEQIQSALNEPSTTGINSQLSQFWSDWSSLADNPTSAAAQQSVIDDAETLSTSFNTLSNTLNGPDPNNPLDPTNSTSIAGQINTQYQNIMAGPSGSGASGGTVYNDAYQISSLNYAIVQAQAAGQSANTLIDQRNAALDNLSSLGNTTVQNNNDGSVTVYFGGVQGTALVDDPAGIPPGGTTPPGDNFGTYSATSGGTGTGWVQAFQSQYGAANTAGTTAATLANTVGGTLGSLIGLAGYSGTGFGDLGQPVDDGTGTPDYPTAAATGAPATQTGTIGQLNAQLNAAATNLMNEVNNPAVDYDGTASLTSGTPPAPTGVAPTSTGPSPNATTQNAGPPATGSPAITLLSQFFQLNTDTTDTGNAAALLEVAPSLVAAAQAGITAGQFTAGAAPGDNGVTNIQTSTLGTSYAGNYSSDNDVALDEANNSGGAADTSYQSLVQTIGSLTQGADNQETTQSALQTQITNQRQSVEGVDLSNEMANLISEQQSYQASAKVMNAFSTVMDSLMEVVGQ